MSKPIYLFKEHQNFQPGKSKLNEDAVFTTHFLGITVALLLSLAALWFGGTASKLQWQYSQTGAETTGELLSCRFTHIQRGSLTYLTYEYTVDGVVYTNEDQTNRLVRCDRFLTGMPATVYYLSDNPQVSRLDSFVDGDEWLLLVLYGVMGLFGLLGTFVFILQNRSERYKYHRLCYADTILEAKVTDIGYVTGKNAYHYARYKFINPQGNSRQDEMRSNQPPQWPEGIQKGDRLHILYVDDDTWCVL